MRCIEDNDTECNETVLFFEAAPCGVDTGNEWAGLPAHLLLAPGAVDCALGPLLLPDPPTAREATGR